MENAYYNGWCSSHFASNVFMPVGRARGNTYVERVLLLEEQKLEEQNMKLQRTNLCVSLPEKLERTEVVNWKEGNDEGVRV